MILREVEHMTYTVLIAEDDSDIVNILRLYLEGGGYQVLTASDGESAYRQKFHTAVRGYAAGWAGRQRPYYR